MERSFDVKLSSEDLEYIRQWLTLHLGTVAQMHDTAFYRGEAERAETLLGIQQQGMELLDYIKRFSP